MHFISMRQLAVAAIGAFTLLIGHNSHAQGIDCQDASGRRVTVSGSSCAFGLTPVPRAPGAEPARPAPPPIAVTPPATRPQPNLPVQATTPPPSPSPVPVAPPAIARPVPAAPAPRPNTAVVALANLVNKYTPTLGENTANKMLGGDARDIVFFFNETDSAPNGVRGLSGGITFSNNTIRLCILGESKVPDDFIDWVKIDWVQQKYTIENFNLKLDRCKFDMAKSSEPKIAAYDLFWVERRLLTNNVNVETPTLVDLAQMIAEKSLAYFSTSEWQPFEVYQEARRAEAEKNLKLLRDGKLDGYGLALLTSELDIVCGSDAEDKEVLNEVASRGLQSFTEPNIRNKRRLTLRQGTAEAIFVQAKRRQCGFIVGDAAYLRPIVNALERDGQKVTISPLWLKQDKVDEILKAVVTKSKDAELQAKRREQEERERDAEATRKQEEERQRVEQQEKLSAAKKANDDKEQQEELKRMRKLVQSRGQALVDGFNVSARKHLSSVSIELAELKDAAVQRRMTDEQRAAKAEARRKERMGDAWSPFPAWVADRAKEEWEFGDTTATLQDYGLAKWRSRSIEAISIKVEVPMTNRHVGERQAACWNFVWINDDEFNFIRNALAVPCDKYPAAFKKWSAENLFKSQWKL